MNQFRLKVDLDTLAAAGVVGIHTLADRCDEFYTFVFYMLADRCNGFHQKCKMGKSLGRK